MRETIGGWEKGKQASRDGSDDSQPRFANGRDSIGRELDKSQSLSNHTVGAVGACRTDSFDLLVFGGGIEVVAIRRKCGMQLPPPPILRGRAHKVGKNRRFLEEGTIPRCLHQ